MNCKFCDIYQSRIGIIYENEHFFAIFDKFPVSLGHSEVIPKRHAVSLFDLTQTEWNNLQNSLSDVVGVIEQTNFKETYQGFINNPLNDLLSTLKYGVSVDEFSCEGIQHCA